LSIGYFKVYVKVERNFQQEICRKEENLMRKIILLLNSPKEGKEKTLAAKWKAWLCQRENEVLVKYLYGEKPLTEVVQEVDKEAADLVIGFNLGGFEVKMFGDDIYWNKLCCPFIQFLSKPLEKKEMELLSERLNATFLFFSDNKETIEKLKGLKFPPFAEYVEKPEQLWEELDMESRIRFGNDI